MDKEVFGAVKGKVSGMLPNRFKHLVVQNGQKSLAVRVDLKGYKHRDSIAHRLNENRSYVDGVCFEGDVLVISGDESNIVDRVRACKEHVLLRQA